MRKIGQLICWTLITKREVNYHILSIILCTIYIENDAEIFPAHYMGR
jgi:hypothetical protein